MTTFPAKLESPSALPRDVAGCFVPGERIIIATKPGIASIVLRRVWAFGSIVLCTALSVWLALHGWMPFTAFFAFMLGLIALAVLAFWGHLDWAMRDFVLTDRRIIAGSGVIRRLTVESPVAALQQVVLYRSLRERLFGLGTIGVATPADAGVPSVVWGYVLQPDTHIAHIRFEMARVAAARGDEEQAERPPRRQQSAMAAANSTRKNTLPVIGLAGGIGSGKSTVAGILARLGCLVVDSDSRAKAALDRPDVRQQLVQWWGEDVLLPAAAGESRRVDRSKVAKIVFADPEQRERLEALVHPIVRQDRAAAATEGAAVGAKAVIVDAPLLFEAGLDAECDAVIFVDAPRQVRLERVRQNRGWTAEELDRREAAQLPLETKRQRADYSVKNEGPVADLEAQVAGILRQILGG